MYLGRRKDMGKIPEAKGGFDGKIIELPSGELTFCHGKWPFIVDFPIKNGDCPLSHEQNTLVFIDCDT